MSLHAGVAAELSPASVAVHDDSNVGRKIARFDEGHGAGGRYHLRVFSAMWEVLRASPRNARGAPITPPLGVFRRPLALSPRPRSGGGGMVRESDDRNEGHGPSPDVRSRGALR